MAKLTTKELEVVELLAEAWNKFVQLPEQHPNHNTEFLTSLHHAQRIVMCRSVSREWEDGILVEDET